MGLGLEDTCNDPATFCQYHKPQIQTLATNLCSVFRACCYFLHVEEQLQGCYVGEIWQLKRV